jgi:AcrR family transcriptional regulator
MVRWMPHTEPRARRTQAERRSQTRRVLLEATIASLVERGYAATTTLEVERRASVSRGARLHHFPSKAALLAAACDHLYDQLSTHYADAFATNPRRKSERQRLRAGLRQLWDVYRHPSYFAVLELGSAARSDPELRQRLAAMRLRHRQLALEAAQQFFPALGSHALRLIETIHASFVGLLSQAGVEPDEQAASLVLSTLEDAVMQELQRNE